MVFSTVVAIFFFLPRLLHVLGLVGHMLFCFPLGGDVQQWMINFLLGEVLFFQEVVLDVLNWGENFAEEEDGLRMRGFKDCSESIWEG